jgi:hypothetical protein
MKKKTKAKQKIMKRRVESREAQKASIKPAVVIPGEVILGEGDIVAFKGRQTVELLVANTGVGRSRSGPIVISLKRIARCGSIVRRLMGFGCKFRPAQQCGLSRAKTSG